MGYRSEWRLAAHGDKKTIKKFVDWLMTHKWKKPVQEAIGYCEKE